MLSQTPSFEGLLEAMPDAVVGVNKRGLIRFVNRQTESLFGYDRDDLLGLPVEVLVPESFRPAHQVHREGYLRHPQTRAMGIGLKLSGRRRDGTQFPVDITLSQLDTDDGLLVIAAVRDMTDRRKARVKRDQMSRLLAVIEFSGVAIVSSTLEGVIMSWNPAAEKLFGYTSAEIMGRSVGLLSPEDRAGEAATILTRVRAGEVVEDFESMRVRKDGTLFPVLLTVSPIYDEYGEIIGASAMPRDRTRQIQAFEAARSMIESSLDSLVAISPDGRITDVNEATVAVTGLPRAELIGTAFTQYFTDPQKAEKVYELAFTPGSAVNYPLTIRHRDGTLTEVLYNASVHRDANAEVLGVFAAARDVTAEVRAQRELAEQQARELVRLAELERFQRMTIDRALKVIELKKEIEELGGSGPAEASEWDEGW
jgi:PAS domain S-box-containing protein